MSRVAVYSVVPPVMDFIRIGGYLFFLKNIIWKGNSNKKNSFNKKNEERKTFALQLKPFGNEVKVMKPIDEVLF